MILTLRSQPHGRLVIASFIVYLKTAGKIPEEEVRVALQQAVGNSIVEEILFGAERRAERRYENGLHEGQRKLLKQLLGQRFGMLPADVLARIDSAATEDLDAMGLRVLTAATLEEAVGASTQTPC